MYSFFNNNCLFSEIDKIDLNHFNDSKKIGTIRHYSNVLTGENFILISNGGRIGIFTIQKNGTLFMINQIVNLVAINSIKI